LASGSLAPANEDGRAMCGMTLLRFVERRCTASFCYKCWAWGVGLS
jgi:hypothetical protein